MKAATVRQLTAAVFGKKELLPAIAGCSQQDKSSESEFNAHRHV
jgi:hypothetical protein